MKTIYEFDGKRLIVRGFIGNRKVVEVTLTLDGNSPEEKASASLEVLDRAKSLAAIHAYSLTEVVELLS